MIIKTYSDCYSKEVSILVQNFYNESLFEYDGLFDSNLLIENLKASNEEERKNSFLMIVDGKCEGIIYGARFKSALSGELVYQEIIWYVNKPFRSHGVELLREVEKILKSQGICIIIMAVLENSKTEKLKRFYQSLGYKPMETHLVRRI